MSQAVAIVCRECKGSCEGPTGYCGWCKAQGHEYVDRAPDGGVPEGCVEWIPATLPDTPPNPLRLEFPRGIPCQ